MYCSNHDEVQFHLDRSLESLLKLVTSISTNPRVSGADKLVLLQMVSDHHRVVAETLAAKIKGGLEAGIAGAVASVSNTDSSPVAES